MEGKEFEAEIAVTRWMELYEIGKGGPHEGKWIDIKGISSKVVLPEIGSEGVNLTIFLNTSLTTGALIDRGRPHRLTDDNRVNFSIELSGRDFESFHDSLWKATKAHAKATIGFYGSYDPEAVSSSKYMYPVQIKGLFVRVDYE